jgi:DNA-binding IscR family transcriptional regulator
LRFVEGPQANKKNPRRKQDTPFTDTWQEVDRAISGILDHTSFADLLRNWSDKQNKFVLNWEI